MKDRPHHRFRNFLYGDPARAVPLLAAAFGLAVGWLSGSLAWGGAAWLLARAVWSFMAARMVIEDTRLGPVTLACGPRTESGRPQLWLTFDDGPGPHTLAIVDILNRHGAAATFFMIGERVADFPQLDLLRERLALGGHRVANHSWSHPSFLSLDPQAVARQVDTTDAILRETFGDLLLPLFRPPFGYRRRNLFAHLSVRGLELMGWSLNSLDFLEGSSTSLARRVGGAPPGAIVLLHDGPGPRARTLEALPALLGELAERGIEATTPSQERYS